MSDSPVPILPYRRAGRGPALVLVHGYLGGSSQWLAEIERLRLIFDVIAVDLAGYGDARHLTSPKSIAAHAQSVLKTLDQLGIQNFHLLGHSMGGMIVQEIVHQAPKRVVRLVLYGTGPQGSIPGRFETMARSRERLAEDGSSVPLGASAQHGCLIAKPRLLLNCSRHWAPASASKRQRLACGRWRAGTDETGWHQFSNKR